MTSSERIAAILEQYNEGCITVDEAAAEILHALPEAIAGAIDDLLSN